MGPSSRRARRAGLAAVLALASSSGLFVFAAAGGVLGSWLAAAAVAFAAASVVGWRLWKRPPVVLLPGTAGLGLKVVSGAATLVALVQLARLTVFMVSASSVGYSTFPSSTGEVRHSCLSAYFLAAALAPSSTDVYASMRFAGPEHGTRHVEVARRVVGFAIDNYRYPPPFLLLPRALRLLAPDFLRLRMLWFGLSGGLVLFVLLGLARWLGPRAGTRLLLLSPLLWLSYSMLGTLQKGNAQLAIVAASVLAMVLFERRHWAWGGALLAFATLGKLFPGLLLVYLLARKQWRALGWTALFALAFVGTSLVDTGAAPYRAFLSHLPEILGGEAFPPFRTVVTRALNMSVPGIALKLQLFGVGAGLGGAKLLGWVFSAVAVALTVVAGRRATSEHHRPLVWLAVLILGTMRSPFLPQTIAAFPGLWLLGLGVAVATPTWRQLALVALAWTALNIYVPMDSGLGLRELALLTSLPQVVLLGLTVLVLWPGPGRAGSPPTRGS